MQVKREGRIVNLEGILNEHVDLQAVESEMMAATQSAADRNGQVVLDLSKVQRANSSGLLQWLRLTKRLKIPLCYINAPVWLVEQFNMIDEFFDGEVHVESIFANFYCTETDSIENHLLKIGTDVPIQDQYKNFQFNVISKQGKTLEPDFDERSYFHFIAKHLSKKTTP